MQDRIEINGVWYVREQPKKEIEVLYFEGAETTTDNWEWKATRLQKEDGSFYKDISIKVVNLKTKAVDEWDNAEWYISLLQNHNGAINHALEVMSMYDLEQFKVFLQTLKDKGWF